MQDLVEYKDMLVPRSYAEATEEERSRVCNGCGTAGWKGDLVPDSIWGLNITAACNAHDWDYEYGKTATDKEIADMRFLRNMIRLINKKGGVLAPIRRYRAMTYYNAVAEVGDDAFWKDK